MSINTNTNTNNTSHAELPKTRKLLNEGLVEASQRGDTELVQQLLEAGADVNVGGCLALDRAAYHGHTEVVKMLIKAGANVYARDDIALEAEGNPFHGSDEIVRMLTDWES